MEHLIHHILGFCGEGHVSLLTALAGGSSFLFWVRLNARVLHERCRALFTGNKKDCACGEHV